MQVAIDLADARHGVYTNLDFVQGRVLLRLPSTAPIVNVTVKLEGESQTMIAPPQDDMGERRPKPVHEFHKILYNTQVVFPEKELPGSTHYTLPPGSYEYPFSFKIPFNSTCHNNVARQLPSFPQYIKHPPPINATHIKAPLPPTLGGFPGLASIRYYVKVTVNRKEFYKENPRQIHHISFVPIEPPRPGPSSTENYGRRTYQFPVTDSLGPDKAPSLKKVFSGLKLNRSATGSSSTSAAPEKTPKVEVDARLPDPAILTPAARVPLRILVKRLDDGTDPIYLQTLQIELVGHTKIRAGQWSRTESSSWVITSHSNMNQLLTFPADAASVASPSTPTAASSKAAEAAGTPVTPTEKNGDNPFKSPNKPRQIALPSEGWSTPLPATVAPSFRTCNIARTYDLDVRVGIGYGPQSARNQIILPLRLKCDVYSGITPPEPLLAAMAKTKPKPKAVSKKPLSAQAQENAAAAAKAHAAAQEPAQGGAGPSTAVAAGIPLDDGEEPPPPSYEDTMAQGLAPIEGPRTYQPAPAPAGDEGFPRDQKRRGS